jgi:hypothetical protein
MLSVLRYEALEAQPAGVLEDRSAVPLDVFIELDAPVGDLPQEVLEPAPALLQRLDPQVDAAQLREIERVEEHPLVVSLTVELLEVCRSGRSRHASDHERARRFEARTDE